MDHSEAEDQVLLTTRAYLLADGDRERAIANLVKDGFSELAASLRSDLIPMAFGWCLLKKMGVTEFPSKFNFQDTGEHVMVADSHVFIAALGLARDVFENGYTEIFSKRVVEMLVSHSAEVDALNKALNSMPDLELSEVTLSSSLFGYTSEDYVKNA